MNPRTSLTILGIIIILLGIIPLAAKAAVLSDVLKSIPEAGSIAYQAALVLIGIIALALSAKPREKSFPQIIVQK